MPLEVGLGIYWEKQLADKLWISPITLKKIFSVEVHEYCKSKRKLTFDEKKYWGTPTFNGAFDQRNKFAKKSWEYLARKYGRELWFSFDPNR